MNPLENRCWLGIDFGTLGARAIAITHNGTCLYEQSLTFGNSQDARSPQICQTLLFQLLDKLL